MLSFLPLKNNSVAIGLNFLLASISVIISSNTINTFLFLVGLQPSNFHKHHQLFLNNEANAFEFLSSLIPTFSLPLISN